MCHLVYPGSGYILLYILDQDILLYPGYTAGRANPVAGHGTTPGPGPGPGTGDLNNC